MATDSETLSSVSSTTLDLTGNRISRTIIRLAWPVVVERLSISILSGLTASGPGTQGPGLVRISFGMYNTKDEVDTLAASLVKAQEFFA